MKKIILLYLVFAAAMAFPILSQNVHETPVQNIPGNITDLEGKASISSTYVILHGTDVPTAAISDFDEKIKY